MTLTAPDQSLQSQHDDKDVVLSVKNVSKRFCRDLKRSLLYGMQDIAGEAFGAKRENVDLRKGEFWALKDVSFELKRGECLGLIGPNGAGKSTLLKMLNGLIKPDHGRIEINGRVGALIELGMGFNPILTGRENIYNNAAVLGLTKAEVDENLESIIEFAEIDEFLDTPVQSYSSGMKVRLGFAVAAHLNPDVLIIDEVLAVGDVGFRSKCYNIIAKIAEETAIILVSHSMPQISRLATQTLLLKQGNTHYFGNTSLAILEYYKLFRNFETGIRAGSGEARFSLVEFKNSKGILTNKFEYGEEFHIYSEILAEIDIENVTIDFGFYTIGDEVAAECNNFVEFIPLKIVKGKLQKLQLIIPEITLNPGLYKVSAFLLSRDMTIHYDWMQYFATIEILGRPAIASQQFRGKWTFPE